MFKRKTKQNILAYILLLPMVIGFVAFSLIPIIKTIHGSLFDMYDFYWDTSGEYFVGFANYKTLFADQNFIKCITNTLFLMIGIPIGMIISFFLATVINSKYARAKKPYLIIYYLPAVSSAVAIGFVWKWLFNADYGAVNQLFGIHVAWLSNPDVVKITLIMKGVWGGIGGTLLLYYASLQNISKEMYECADIAGANVFQKTIHITIPLVNNTTFYVLVTGVIGGVMAFADNYIIADSISAKTVIYYLYEKMQRGDYGLVTAGSTLVFFALFVLTLIQFGVNHRLRKAS